MLCVRNRKAYRSNRRVLCDGGDDLAAHWPLNCFLKCSWSTVDFKSLLKKCRILLVDHHLAVTKPSIPNSHPISSITSIVTQSHHPVHSNKKKRNYGYELPSSITGVGCQEHHLGKLWAHGLAAKTSFNDAAWGICTSHGDAWMLVNTNVAINVNVQDDSFALQTILALKNTIYSFTGVLMMNRAILWLNSVRVRAVILIWKWIFMNFEK